MSLLHVITDFVSFVTAFLLKNPSLTHAVVPPFRNRSRSSRLFGCKSPHDGSLSLPTFADSRTGASPVPTVVRNYRFAFLSLAKDCKGLNPINNSQKNKGYSKRYILYSLANDFNFNTMHPLWKLESALWVRGCKANGSVHIVNYTIFYNDSLIISYVLIDGILTSIKFCGITIKIEHKSYDKK